MGYMPYPGRGNQEVMQMVTGGSRLEPPDKCPGPVYHLMTQCWHSDPEERPCFSVIIERLGYCLQDPDVTSVELPMTSNAPSMDYEGAAIIFSAPRQSKDHVFNESAPLLSSPSTVEVSDEDNPFAWRICLTVEQVGDRRLIVLLYPLILHSLHPFVNVVS